LYSAVSNNQLKAAQVLLDFDASIVNELNEFESTALFTACYSGHDALAKMLIERGADYIRDQSGFTPLIAAVSHGDTELVDALIQNGANVDYSKDSDGNTALHLAIINGQANFVEYFLANDKLWEEPNNCGDMPLILALEHLNLPILLLIKSKPKCKETVREFRGAENRSLLHMAVLKGSADVLQVLLREFDIDCCWMDQFGHTALYYAVLKKNCEFVKLIMEAGGSLTGPCQYSTMPPFVVAVLSNQLDIVKLYIEKEKDAIHHLKEYSSNGRNLLVSSVMQNNFAIDESGINLLHYVAYTGKLNSVKFLIDRAFFTRTSTDANGKTIGHYAASNKQRDVIEFLISSQFPLDQLDNDGRSALIYRMPTRDQETLLHVTARKGYLSMLALLLEKGVFDIDIGDVDQTTALQDATMTGRKECINLLLQHGANINFVDLQNTTALTRACVNSQKEIAELLLNLGADTANTKAFHVETREGATALHIAILGDLSLMELLVKRIGININTVDACGRTVLHIASQIGSIQAAEESLRLGACADLIDQYRRTAFVTALESGHEEVAERLLVATQDKEYLRDFRMEETLKSVLHIALEKGFDRMISLLLNNYGLDCNCTDFEGKSILHYAVAGERGLTEMLTLILSEIDVMHVDKHGMTPLHYAAGCNQLEMIELLVNAGAEVDCFDVHKTTPLMRAISKNHLEAYHKLVSLGANVDLARQFRNNNFDGESILHIAAEKNRIEAMKFLVEELKCDVDCIDKNGNTPLHYALQKGCFEVVKYLLGKNANL
ncbi:AAEL002332-PA, partial [Aedes aegypti]